MVEEDQGRLSNATLYMKHDTTSIEITDIAIDPTNRIYSIIHIHGQPLFNKGHLRIVL